MTMIRYQAATESVGFSRNGLWGKWEESLSSPDRYFCCCWITGELVSGAFRGGRMYSFIFTRGRASSLSMRNHPRWA